MKNFINPFLPKKPIGSLTSSACVKRHSDNPLLTSRNVPYHTDLVFNAGVTKFGNKYYMAFRYDVFQDNNRQAGLFISGSGLAESDDGIRWTPHDQPIKFHYRGHHLLWVNDARLSVIDNQLYLSFCFNSEHGERPGIAVWRGNDDFEVIFLGVPAQRNMILCQDKINGKYWRLERPISHRNIYDIWVSYSEDLIHWGESELLLGVEDVPFATFKIGGGPPPVLTNRGFLLFFHSVDQDPARRIIYPEGAIWELRYTAGAVLLDREDPFKLLAITKKPILVAETQYETGNTKLFWRENVVFPCGAILEEENRLRLYYGAGDYSTCLAEIHLNELWREMTPYSRLCPMATFTGTEVKNGHFGWTKNATYSN